MPIIVPRKNKAQAINEITYLAQKWIFPNAAPPSREAIMAHLKWMYGHEDELMVACRFETDGTRRTTRIVFECSFVQQQPNIKTGELDA